MRRLPLTACLAILAGGGCGGERTETVDAALVDQSAPQSTELGRDDGGGPVFAAITFAGCQTLTFVGGVPRCAGVAPLALTLVPVGATGTSAWLWSTPGGAPDSSTARTPAVVWRAPGTWTVTLVVSGPSGSATASGVVVVSPAPTGAACDDDIECEPGYTCVCATTIPTSGLPDAGLGDGTIDEGVVDAPPLDAVAVADAAIDAPVIDAAPVLPPDLAGSLCPVALGAGLCTRACDTSPCAPGEVCIDLGRAVAADPTLASSPWRRALCLPGCVSDASCRPGFRCRELPGLAISGPAAWSKACFAAGVLGDVGTGCDDGSGGTDPGACSTGDCAALGARGACSLDCTVATCPSDATCATFATMLGALCVARCDAMHPCLDPLLACQTADASGALGFTVPTSEPSGATYCTPRRCTQGTDCEPAGTCDAPDGGAGFCHR